MRQRRGAARSTGTLKEGAGTVRFGSGARTGPSTQASAFESGPGTDPEELTGAAGPGREGGRASGR
jgi:osmotically inducible protein OsmC